MLATKQSFHESRVYMDTIVSIAVEAAERQHEVARRIERGFGWFAEVERRCSRFDPSSELRALCRVAGRPVAVSPLLYQLIALSLQVADATDGAFDPTVGATMEARGIDRNYRTGARAGAGLQTDRPVSYRDVALDAHAMTVTLAKPLLLDLGAIAKGFAIDLASEELRSFESASVNAGGDIRLHRSGAAEPWLVGIKHPRHPESVTTVVEMTNGAICTSGDYERTSRAGHHIVRPHDGATADAVASVSVVAPTAAVADALSTAAFVLGPVAGPRLLEAQGVEGLVITTELRSYATKGLVTRTP